MLHRYITISLQWKLMNNIDVIAYFAGDNDINVSMPKSAAVKDIDIDIADILGQKYRYRIDIGKGDIDPPLVNNIPFSSDVVNSNVWVTTIGIHQITCYQHTSSTWIM